MPKALESVPPA